VGQGAGGEQVVLIGVKWDNLFSGSPLENHWNGSILDEIETALNLAASMTWKGKHPIVKLVTQTYATGVKLTKKAMSEIEKQIERLTHSQNEFFPNLGNWFIDINFAKT
jgi:hypothetical protein